MLRLPGLPVLSSRQAIRYSKQVFGFYIHQKPFFSYNLNMIIKFLMIHYQFVLKSLLLLRIKLLILFF